MRLLDMSLTDNTINKENFLQRMTQMKEEMEFQAALLDFMEDDTIHPEIRGAFLKILHDEGLFYGAEDGTSN